MKTSNVDYSGLTDEDLVERRSEIGAAAVEIISSRYLKTISYFCRLYLDNPVNARFDDMLQEGLIALYSAVESFDPAKGAKFRTYACVCIKNRLLSFINTDIKTESGVSDTLEEDTAPSPENIFIEKETEKTLFESLRRVLSEREFAVLSLRIDGYSYADIALTLNLTQKSIDNTMSRIRGKLRK